jgi:hypothetical protein
MAGCLFLPAPAFAVAPVSTAIGRPTGVWMQAAYQTGPEIIFLKDGGRPYPGGFQKECA